MKAIEIKKDIYWVGALDPGLRIFDIVMYTPYGTTYNSYIVKGSKKTAIFETVKEKFFDEYLARLESLNIDIKNIDYIVVDHTEPDHAGSVEKLLDIAKNAKVVGSSTAIKFLQNIVNHSFEYIEVKDGSSLDLGGKTLKFISAPLLHWPDTIYTYVPEEKLLITCDSFGCHYSSEKIFNDLIEDKEKYMDALKYYFDCIMGPFKPYVLKAYNKIKDLPIDIICPGHGPILRDNPKKVVELYKKWSTEDDISKNKEITICYVSAYGYTKEIAHKIAEGIKSVDNFTINSFDVIYSKEEEIISKINSSIGLLFGSPTITSDALRPIYDVINSLNPIIHGGRFAGAFGSYGWSGEAVPNIEERLKQLRMKLPVPGLKINFKPSKEDNNRAYNFGRSFAEKIKENLNKTSANIKSSSTIKKWKCIICGVVFEGTKPPEFCPVCGASKDQFIEITENKNLFKSENAEKVVIVGNGAAGYYAAEAIRKRNKKCTVEIISSENRPTYFRPELSDYLTENIEDSKFYVSQPSWYEDNRIILRLNSKVIKINPANKELLLSDGSKENYDKLILSTGSHNFKPDLPGIDKNGVYTLKDINDANNIKNHIKTSKNAVVIGGGLLGLEAASEMKKSGLNVTVVEFFDRLLPKQLDKSGANLFEKLISKNGINLILGDSCTGILGNTSVSGVRLKSGRTINADMVLFSIGIRPNKKLAEECGIKTNKGILVNENMETNVKEIYAAGDAAELNGIIYGNWTAAVEMGKTAGANAVGDKTSFKDFVSSVIFDALGTSVVSFGDVTNTENEKLQFLNPKLNECKTLFFMNNVLSGGYLIGNTSAAGKLILAMKDNKSLKEILKDI
ncbi:FAD-dependent oxidoreductase [Clostridium guangxiense]|uniref:FAD-dependent oxidoreductase n=2 Tax=Clostridium TaxID=1485 RepID=UPI001E4AF408|nr:FAD-dependent oxidoreductase [Clostridium guangxiense]MCD2346309.1 FAD-dependent oxidoreductase [Clostridium guangxiense]